MTTEDRADPVVVSNGELAWFADMALDLHAASTSEHTLEGIVDYARAAVTCDDAGVMLVHSRNRIVTAAATSDRARRAHELQTELDEGPCLDAASEPATYIVEDTLAEDRWPRWGSAVAELGVRSAISVRLQARGRRIGSLNLYADKPFAFTADDLAVAQIFARHASVALATSQETDGLHRAMDARKIIGIAMGILMERYSIDSERAFDVLRRYSQTNNVKLRDVARQVAERRALPDG